MTDWELIEHMHARGWNVGTIDVPMIREACAVLWEQEADALQWKFECFIDFATGGRLSKSSWALETLKAAVTEYINAEIIMHTEQEASATGAEPMRKHVEDFAAGCGWKREDGEGAFEFVQRTSYRQGWQDGRRESMGDVHRDTPEVATPTTSTTGKVDASRVRDEALEEAAQLYGEGEVAAPGGHSQWGDAHQEGWIDGTKAYRDAIRSLIGTPKSAEGEGA